MIHGAGGIVERNTHWNEWRAAVERTGYTPALAHASRILEELDSMAPESVEGEFCRVMLINEPSIIDTTPEPPERIRHTL